MKTFLRFIFVVFCSCPFVFAQSVNLDSLMQAGESERPGIAANELVRFADKHREKICSIVVEEGGFRAGGALTLDKDPKYSPDFRGKWRIEMVASPKKAYGIGRFPNGRWTKTTFDGSTAMLYWFDPENKMFQADKFCSLPSSPSSGLNTFVEVTGIGRWSNGPRIVSNEAFADRIRTMKWLERKTHASLGDIAVLETKTSTNTIKSNSDRALFGVHDGNLVCVGIELESKNIFPEKIDGKTAVADYKTLVEIRYGKKFGPLLPESWTYLTSREIFSMEGKALFPPLVDYSQLRQLVAFKTLASFPDAILNIPIDPKAKLVDYCEKKVQAAIAESIAEEPKKRKFFWILALGLASCFVAIVMFVRRVRK